MLTDTNVKVNYHPAELGGILEFTEYVYTENRHYFGASPIPLTPFPAEGV
jgi:hypothetical protein